MTLHFIKCCRHFRNTRRDQISSDLPNTAVDPPCMGRAASEWARSPLPWRKSRPGNWVSLFASSSRTASFHDGARPANGSNSVHERSTILGSSPRPDLHVVSKFASIKSPESAWPKTIRTNPVGIVVPRSRKFSRDKMPTPGQSLPRLTPSQFRVTNQPKYLQ